MINLKIKITATIIKDDKILLIKEKNTSDDKYYWNLVKGTFEPEKDENLFETVIRECLEEVNTRVKIKNLINFIYYRRNNKIRLQFNFLCTGNIKKSFLSNRVNQASRNEQIVEIKLFTREELSKIKRKEFMDERVSCVLNDFLNNKINDISIIKEIIKL